MKTNGIDIRLVPQVWSVLEKGYENATQALSKILNDEVSHKEVFAGLHAMTTAALASFDPFKKDHFHFVVTTELFGDLRGKSYLMLSHDDLEVLSRHLGLKNPTLKTEFLKELDNILSAAVITKLSNELMAKVYGDIPILLKDVTNLTEMIISDFSSHSSQSFLSAVYLEIKQQPAVNPLFLWVIDQTPLTKLMANSPSPITTLR